MTGQGGLGELRQAALDHLGDSTCLQAFLDAVYAASAARGEGVPSGFPRPKRDWVGARSPRRRRSPARRAGGAS